MPNFNISINPELARIIEHEMKEKKYSSRSEFFRDIIRDRFVTAGVDYNIAQLSRSDPDYEFVKKRKRGAQFVPLSVLLCR